MHVNTVHRHSKKRILTAALEIHKRHGLDGVSIRKVAARVGLSPSAIYRHYANHAALLDAMAEEGYRIFTGVLERALDGEGPVPIDRLRDAYLDFALTYREFYELMFVVEREEVRRFPDDFEAHRAAAFDVLVSAVQAEIESGLIEEQQPIDLSLAIWAQLHGLVTMHRAGRFGSDEDLFRRVYGRTTSLFLEALRAQSHPDEKRKPL